MSKKELYIKNKTLLINNPKINPQNRKLFKKFLEWEEYKLKRTNGLRELDEGCYKTLYSYVAYLNNSNTWFKNKEWKKLTKTDIKKVYDDLEDGKLKGKKGNVIEGKSDYYHKIFRSKPFELAGKKKLAIEVMEFYTSKKNKSVRFFDESTFKRIVNATKTIHQRLLCWLAWDFGENIFTLLQLQKKDFVRRIDKETGEPEYLLVFDKGKLKRSRSERTEPTLYSETTELLDMVLDGIEEEDNLFNFEHRNALKFLKQIREKTGSKCINGEEITWKDFRSSMACHLLNKGFTTDEIKSRLGHKPSSDVLDVYVTYLALGRRKPKQKIESGKIKELQEELQQLKLTMSMRIKKGIDEYMEGFQNQIHEYKEKLNRKLSISNQ